MTPEEVRQELERNQKELMEAADVVLVLELERKDLWEALRLATAQEEHCVGR
jgi:hypothetical protein